MNVYQVVKRKIYTGCRIEGIDYNIKTFIDKNKALEFAYNLAKKYIQENKDEDEYQLPIEVDSPDFEEMLTKYTWPDDSYDVIFPVYFIQIVTNIIELDKDIINTIILGV